MKFSITIVTALASVALAAPVPQQSPSLLRRGTVTDAVGGALELAGSITSGAGAATVGGALSTAGGAVKGAGGAKGSKAATKASGGRGRN